MIKAEYCCVPKPLQPLFNVAIELFSQRLGIDSYNATVKFHLSRPGTKAYNGKYEGGSMYPSFTKENAERIKTGLPPKTFDLRITIDTLDKMVISFVHEMRHVRQYLTQELVTKNQNKIDLNDKTKLSSLAPEDKCLYYRGIPVDTLTTPYEELPWEVEPYTNQVEDAKWLMNALTKNEDKILAEVKTMNF